MLLTPEKKIITIPLVDDITLPADSHSAAGTCASTCIHQMFEEQVKILAASTAVCFGDHQLSYEQLNKKANQVAHYLIEQHQVTPDTLVGLCLNRSVNMLVGLLGILKAGAAYVPIDPIHPKERVRYIINDAHLSVILTEQVLSQQLDFAQASPICLDNSDTLLNSCSDKNITVSDIGLNEDHLAYVIYTSGSTGQPKGVCQTHSTITNLIRHTNKHHTRSRLKTLQFTPVTFDVSVQEIFSSLTTGSCLQLIDNETKKNFTALIQLIQSAGVERLFLPPAVFDCLAQQINQTNEILVNLKEINLAGEQVNLTLPIRQFITQHPQCEFYNQYGPTETHVVTEYRFLANDENKVPIGKVISNTEAHVLDAQLKPVADGQTGELFIGGDGLARGYLNQPALSAERFITNPFYQNGCSHQLYRTGDRVRYLQNGELMYLGRKDDQIKIRGFRIEPGEISHQLCSNERVDSALVLAQETEQGKQLVGYVKVTGSITEPQPLISVLMTELKETLPDYMIPAGIIVLADWPLTANGKVDKKQLPPLHSDAPLEYIAQNTQQATFLDTMKSLLKRKNIDVKQSFYGNGGDSISAQLLLFKLQKQALVVQLNDLVSSMPVLTLLDTLQLYDAVEPEQSGQGCKFKTTELQKAMLFQSLIGKNKMVNTEQWVCRVDGFTGLHILNTLKQLISHYPLLSAKPCIEKGGVFLDPADPISINPILEEVSASHDLQEVIQADAQQGFELKSGLFRAKVFYNENRRDADVLFSFHHAIVDGLSAKNLLEHFSMLLSDPHRSFAPSQSFDTYISQLSRQRKHRAQASEAFWCQYLANIDVKNTHRCQDLDRNNQKFALLQQPISKDTLNNIFHIARQQQVSAASIFNMLWGETLCEYSGQSEAHYTSVISLRYPELAGADSVFGPCINICPNRFTLHSEQQSNPIQLIEENNRLMRQFASDDLSQIRQYANLSAEYESALWSLFCYQNFPETDNTLCIKQVRNYWYASQPMCVMVFPSQSPRLELGFSSRFFTQESAQHMMQSYLTRINTFPNRR